MKEDKRKFLEELDLKMHFNKDIFIGYIGGYYSVTALEVEKAESVDQLKNLICEKVDVQATAIKNTIRAAQSVYKNFQTLDQDRRLIK